MISRVCKKRYWAVLVVDRWLRLLIGNRLNMIESSNKWDNQYNRVNIIGNIVG